MLYRGNSRLASILTLLVLWTAVYLAGIFSPPLLDDVDSVHAEAAREIVLRHDWVTLHTDGIRYLEKAPLMYWAIAASYKVFGISDWSTRLPLVLAMLCLLLSTYALGAATNTAKRADCTPLSYWALVLAPTSSSPDFKSQRSSWPCG